MLTSPSGKKPEVVLKELVNLIEEFRIRRQADAAEQLHPELKTFSQRELTDVACPSYKNYLLGRTLRLPERDMVIHIAEYLECTPAECDELLICAGYLPESFVLNDAQYQAAIRHAMLLMKLLPLPATVIGRYGEAIAANQAVFNKCNTSTMEELSQSQRNIISWFFDPALSAHHSYAASPDDWRKSGRGAAELLYLTNSMRLRDPAFRRFLRKSRELPDFGTFWDDVVCNPPSLHSKATELNVITRFLDRPIREMGLVLPITESLEVVIVAGVPMDEAGRYVYDLLGCQIDSARWETIVADFSLPF